MDVDKQLKELTKQTSSKSFQELPAHARKEMLNKLRYLKGLKSKQITPDKYILHYIPVIPPKYRPAYIFQRVKTCHTSQREQCCDHKQCTIF